MRYPITFWYGIPTEFVSKERVEEAVNDGFNIIECKYDKETNFKVLRWCEELGVDAFVGDDRMQKALCNEDHWEDNLREMVFEYSEYKALKCWFLKDEPNDSLFPELARVVDYMKKIDKDHKIYINLLPLPAILPHDNYQKHIDNYLNTVKPELLSYDHYSLAKREVKELTTLPGAAVSKECIERNHWEEKIFEAWDREGFYDNLEMIRKSADDFGIPWMDIILLVEHWNYRKPSETELRWEAFTSFAYGSKLLSYFTYWTPGVAHTEPWSYHHGIIESDGTRDPNYEIVKTINKDLQLLFNETMGTYPTYIAHTKIDEKELKINKFEPRKEVKKITAENVLYSEYNDEMFMLVNKLHSKEQMVSVEINQNQKLMYLCKNCGKWDEVPFENGEYKLNMEPGDGILFKVKGKR